jgi:hypothetical protein
VGRILKKQRLLGCFVLHNPAKTLFQKNWARYPFYPQPIYDIKEYFGEKFALFYAFLDHYTMSLFIPALIAIPLQICIFVFNDFSGKRPFSSPLFLSLSCTFSFPSLSLAPFIPVYSVILPIWAAYMTEVSFISLDFHSSLIIALFSLFVRFLRIGKRKRNFMLYNGVF